MNKFKTITSVQNQEIKEIVKLREPKARKEANVCLVEGFRANEIFLSSKHELFTLYVTEKNLDKIVKLANPEKIIITSDAVMEKISGAKSASGILGVYNIAQVINKLTSGIVLAQLSDPANVGLLIRSAYAFGLKTAVAIDTVDIWSPKVIQSCAGMIANMDVYVMSWEELLKSKGKLNLIGLVVKNGKPIAEISKENNLFVLGSEAHGIPEQWLKNCDQLMTLEMPGRAESLNVAIAGSVALYITQIMN